MSHDIRNIAIIAHVDHGKTTLVDKMLQATGTLGTRLEPVDRVLDSNDQERERGITILSKNTAVEFRGVKINIIDTPGHSDFGGEVERVLSMADGCLLLVDAFEGPMPQTRFVLRKALEKGLQPVVVINKIDRPDSRCPAVLDEVFDLFCELTEDESLLEFPTVYASAKNGFARREEHDDDMDLVPLFETILESVPAPAKKADDLLQYQVSLLDYSEFVGVIGIGRIHQGALWVGQQVAVAHGDQKPRLAYIQQLFTFKGLERVPAERVECGDIAALIGVEGLGIYDTVTDPENPQPMPVENVDDPTMSMMFRINNSPFAGLEGRFVTSRHIRDRLDRELKANVALRVEETGSADTFKVSGRGVLHLSVLIETMRREGYEFAVGKPRVILKEVNGKKYEPIELLIVDVKADLAGKVIELAGGRRGEVQKMETSGTMAHLEMKLPSRGMVGLRTRLLTATMGEAVLHHSFSGYEPYKGDIPGRGAGVQVSMENGNVATYALDNLSDRGDFFVEHGTKVYEGQIVGEHCRGNDITVNVCRAKKHTNMRASGSDRKLFLAPPRLMSLEEALEYIDEDELVEVTPTTLRLRKIHLNEKARKRHDRVLN